MLKLSYLLLELAPIYVNMSSKTTHQSPVNSSNSYFPDEVVTTIKEQTNIYAQQKEAPHSFKPVTYKDINVFLYVNMMFRIHQMPAVVMYWSKDPLLRVSAVADVLFRVCFWQSSRYFHLADCIVNVSNTSLAVHLAMILCSR